MFLSRSTSFGHPANSVVWRASYAICVNINTSETETEWSARERERDRGHPFLYIETTARARSPLLRATYGKHISEKPGANKLPHTGHHVSWRRQRSSPQHARMMTLMTTIRKVYLYICLRLCDCLWRVVLKPPP